MRRSLLSRRLTERRRSAGAGSEVAQLAVGLGRGELREAQVVELGCGHGHSAASVARALDSRGFPLVNVR